MQFEISHRTLFTYSRPVFLEPQTLRFRPRADDAQWLEAFELSVTPEPDGMTGILDADGNSVAQAWFSGLHEHLEITTRARVQTLRENPFDFLLDSSPPTLPFTYPESLTWLLAPARHRQIRRSDDDPVYQFAQHVRRDARDIYSYLDQLSRVLHHEFDFIHRERGGPNSPVETLRIRQGACRDLAVLFIDAARAMGLAARFVSGYQADANQDEHSLHAWAEVFLPGAGWRGYDPTQGLLVSDRHIAVAAAVDPADAAPVSALSAGRAPHHKSPPISRCPSMSLMRRRQSSSCQ